MGRRETDGEWKGNCLKVKSLEYALDANDDRSRGDYVGAAAKAIVVFLEGLTLCRVVELSHATHHQGLKVGRDLIVRPADAGDCQVSGGPQEQEDRDTFPYAVRHKRCNYTLRRSMTAWTFQELP
jgi:hypothetical protein